LLMVVTRWFLYYPGIGDFHISQVLVLLYYPRVGGFSYYSSAAGCCTNQVRVVFILHKCWLGWLIPPLLSYILFALFVLGYLKVKEGRNNFYFCRKILFDPPQGGARPPKSGNSKLSKQYVVGTLNLYLKTPCTMQKETDQSDHPVLRKRSKHADLLQYFDVSLKQQNRTTFWTFSLDRVIGLNQFL
jgi:hypothetical protein